MPTPDYLLQKYNVPAPRYTSYPTVPFWDPTPPRPADWLRVVKQTFAESNATKGISLYLHLPFCESLCTYCGCNTRITRNHSVEKPYIDLILAEWNLYLGQFPEPPLIRELHLGGGTPTFFSPDSLAYLFRKLLATARVHPAREFSFEGHPKNTTTEHLQTLYDFGFRRVSFGIQDCDEKVQRTINRIQPFENVERVTAAARAIGYASVNFDLIYGLPYQTPASVGTTIDQIATLRPDRIAFYSYAHVPWIKPGQRSYTEKDLPDHAAKRALYEIGLRKLTALGYADIGMDHFALPGDDLFKAREQQRLQRNFMGYTTCQTDLLLGLGCSSISDAKYAYLQNEKKLEDYRAKVLQRELPVLKGHLLTPQDQHIRQHILHLTCKGLLELPQEERVLLPEKARETLAEMEKEGLLHIGEAGLEVTTAGKAFVRNICLVFDARYHEGTKSPDQLFSKAI